MRKLFRKIHLWLAVPLGLLMTVLCFSGAMLVFEQELTEAFRPSLYKVEATAARPLPLGVLAARVAATLPDSVQVTGITVSADPERAYQVNLSKPRRAAMMVNPYTGQVLGRVERPAFFAKMFFLHRWLLDNPSQGGPSVGKVVVGITTLCMVLVLLSGAGVWWPRSRRALRESLKIPFRRGLRRMWYGWHVAGGVYALVFLCAMALTGLTWSFGWYRTGFYALFGVEAAQGKPSEGADARKGGAHGPGRAAEGAEAFPNHKGRPAQRGGKPHAEKEAATMMAGQSARPENRHGAEASEHPATTDFSHWQQVLDTLKQARPDFRQITVQDGKATISASRYGNTRASDRYEFDAATGQITCFTPYAEGNAASKLRGWIFAVHTGAWGGYFTRILAFLAALLGASLPLTGYYLWYKRISAKRRKA